MTRPLRAMLSRIFMPMQSREVRLARHPQGEPTLDDFSFVTVDVPDPGPGEALVRNVCMSVDPYMRGRMNPGKSYVPPFQIGRTHGGRRYWESRRIAGCKAGRRNIRPKLLRMARGLCCARFDPAGGRHDPGLAFHLPWPVGRDRSDSLGWPVFDCAIEGWRDRLHLRRSGRGGNGCLPACEDAWLPRAGQCRV